MIAEEVMDRARVHLNDVMKDVFNDDVLLPFLISAWEELQSTMQNNGLPIMTETTAPIDLPALTFKLNYSTSPALPANFLEPKFMYERAPGTINWTPMTEGHGLTINENIRPTLGVWEWTGDDILFIGASNPREILIRYMRGLDQITSPNSNLAITGAKRYLSLKCAAEASEDIGQNRARSDRLETKAEFELSRFISIRVKLQQDRSVRRRGYNSKGRAGWQSPLPY